MKSNSHGKNYDVRAEALTPCSSRLMICRNGVKRMPTDQSMLKALEFIEDNITEEISLYDISRAAGFSVPHFYRMFKRLTGDTVGAYLLRRRLSLAARDIIKTNRTITSIAYEYGFESHDVFTRAFYKFNPHDLKSNKFITAGQAWKLCREGLADPGHFGIDCPIRPEWGIDSLYGLWFVRGQLLRDFAALNKVETVPYLVRICQGLDWKAWRLVAIKDQELTEEDYRLLDEIAELTIQADQNYPEICRLYIENKELTVPEEILLRE